MRIVNRLLTDSYRDEPCIVCGATFSTVAHHVKTKKSGGHDVENNLVAVCFSHHREWHDKGNNHMADKYRQVKEWFTSNGWNRCPLSKKWLNPEVFR